MTDQYSTPDGSIWERSQMEPTRFLRVEGPGHEMDFRAQSLNEVLKGWGPLNWHDPIAVQAGVLAEAMMATGRADEEVAGRRAVEYVRELAKRGYEIRKKDE